MEELRRIQKRLKAPKNQFNEFGQYNYRNCEDILEAVKPLLDECTLTLSDEIVQLGERYYIKCTATLRNGSENEISVAAYAREASEKKGMDAAQITGSASSYARKYALNGLFLIDDAKDDDNRQPTDKKFKRQAPTEDNRPTETKSGEAMSAKQRTAIISAGKSLGLSEDEVRKLVKWKAEKENLDPNSWKVCKFFLGKNDSGDWNFEISVDEYMTAQAEAIS